MIVSVLERIMDWIKANSVKKPVAINAVVFRLSFSSGVMPPPKL